MFIFIRWLAKLLGLSSGIINKISEITIAKMKILWPIQLTHSSILSISRIISVTFEKKYVPFLRILLFPTF